MKNIITDQEFKNLWKMPKYFVNNNIILPLPRENKIYNIISSNKKEKFVLDTSRSGVYSLYKAKLQNRYASNIPLIRLEIDSPPHMNQDGTKSSRNHIHIFKEGYGLTIAYDLECYKNINLNSNELKNFNKVFNEFCKFCNINIDNIEIQEVIT